MRRLLTGIILLIWLVPSIVSADTKVLTGTVMVKTKNAVNTDEIRLGDIAEIRGFDNENRERLANLVVSNAPKPGDSRTFSGRYVERLISPQLNNATIKVPKQVTVARDARHISPADIKMMFTEEVIDRLAISPDRIIVDKLNLKNDLLVPETADSLNISFTEGETFRGLTTARIDVGAGDQHYRTYFVTAEVKVLGYAVTADRKIRRGEELQFRDVRLDEIVLSEAPESVVTDPSTIIGLAASRDLKPGDVLTERSVVKPLLVDRGNLVTLVVEEAGMRIEAQGIAQQKGRRDQTIKVMNLGSEKIVYGIVVSEDEVHVRY